MNKVSRTPAERELIVYWPEMILPREEAERQGLTIYRTGEPCAIGHHAYRDTRTMRCLLCRQI